MHYRPFLLNLIIFATLFVGCSTSWTKVIRYGEVDSARFKEVVNITVERDLIFLPVSIGGKRYKFLFDSGAPLSVSEAVQADHEFKVISEGNIVDSDNNRTKVEWCMVEEMDIGGVTFRKHAAFVGNFKANPILACFEIDGIIGSNLLRQCNWEIDQENLALTLSKNEDLSYAERTVKIPFSANTQYSMFMDLQIGQVTISNVLVDYGFNGSVSLTDEVFSQLEEGQKIGEVIVQKGTKRSGVIGKAVEIERRITYTDSVRTGDFVSEKVMLRTGRKASIGSEFLSRFYVAINWDEKMLYLTPREEEAKPVEYGGFALGYSEERGIHVASIIEGSRADLAGVRPGMKVTKLDHLNFEAGDDFCDYVDHLPGRNFFLEVIDEGGIKEYRFEKTSW